MIQTFNVDLFTCTSDFGYAENCQIPTAFGFGFKFWHIPSWICPYPYICHKTKSNWWLFLKNRSPIVESSQHKQLYFNYYCFIGIS